MAESVLFSFPSIGLAPPHSPSTPGQLVLTSSSQPAQFDPSRRDVYLRIRHTPEQDASLAQVTDCLIEAWRELRKTSPTEFVLASEFGDLTISFPALHTLIPAGAGPADAAADGLPAAARRGMTWELVVQAFESEVDRFVRYRKNSYSLVGSPFAPPPSGPGLDPTDKAVAAQAAKAREAGYASPSHAGSGGYGSAPIKPYNPSSYPSAADEKRSPAPTAPAAASAAAASAAGGRLVLVDEVDGREVGETHVSAVGVVPGSKDPVEISFPENGEGPVMVRTADYLRDASDPAYQNSSLVQTAATVSRLIVTTSAYLSGAMASGARSFSDKTAPCTTPVTFHPSTHQRFQQVYTLTATAAKFSSATVGKVSTLAQNAGARLARKDSDRPERGRPRNPNILNKSLIAFSTVADGIDYASKSLLGASSQAATQVVGHRYGDEAANVARNLTGSVRNVGLVYIDASGVSRRAVVRGVAKGMVVGRVKGGGEVVVPASSGPIDGLPAGWGDGPMGGPHAGPPSGRSTPVNGHSDAPPPGYEAPAGSGSNSMYFSPPPGAGAADYHVGGSPGARPPLARQASGKGEFRF